MVLGRPELPKPMEFLGLRAHFRGVHAVAALHVVPAARPGKLGAFKANRFIFLIAVAVFGPDPPSPTKSAAPTEAPLRT